MRYVSEDIWQARAGLKYGCAAVPIVIAVLRLGVGLDGLPVWVGLLAVSTLLFSVYTNYCLADTSVLEVYKSYFWVAIAHGSSVAAVFSVTAGLRGGIDKFVPGILLIGTIVITVSVFLGLVAVTPVIRWVLRHFREFVQGNQCRRCGYDLTGLSSSRCPECGWRASQGDGPEHHEV